MQRTAASGFTIIELLITLIVITILTTLGVASVTSLQRDARDVERKEDIASIARGLENFYKQGNPYVAASSGYVTVGTYPGSMEFSHMAGVDYCSDTYFNSIFSPCSGGTFQKGLGISEQTAKPPSIPSGDRGIYVKGEVSDTVLDQKLQDGNYIYVPIQKTGGTDVCYGMNDYAPYDVPCTSYILKYKEETTGNIIEVKSKHQQ